MSITFSRVQPFPQRPSKKSWMCWNLLVHLFHHLRLSFVSTSKRAVSFSFSNKRHCSWPQFVFFVKDLTSNDWKILEWILEGSFNTKVHKESILREKEKNKKKLLVEIGPRLNFSTAFSTNAVSICEASGITKKVQRIERSTLYFISLQVSYVAWRELFQSNRFEGSYEEREKWLNYRESRSNGSVML